MTIKSLIKYTCKNVIRDNLKQNSWLEGVAFKMADCNLKCRIFVYKSNYFFNLYIITYNL